MVRLPAISAPRSRTLRSDKTLFYHPGYPSPVNILFGLPRVDQSPSQPDLFGVDAQIALLACQIVANNAFVIGYLASDDKGTRRADTGPDSVLTQSEYWFFVQDDVPPRSTTIILALANHRISIDLEPVLCYQHIVHLGRGAYHTEGGKRVALIDGMHRYGSGRYDVDDPSNIVTLRSDVYICLDRRAFASAPKPEEHQVKEFVVHVLDPRHTDFATSYQNRTVYLSEMVSQEYLFARFAWAVIHLVKPFIVGGVDRRIAKFSRVKTGSDDGGGKGLPKAKIELLEGASLMALYGGGGGRSASPRKRKASSPKDERDFDEFKEKSAKEVSDDDWYAEHLELVLDRESPRGRKRQRLSDSFTTDMTTPLLSYSPASNGSIGIHDVSCHPGSIGSGVDLSKTNLDETTSAGL